jgi:hypothetical protein
LIAGDGELLELDEHRVFPLDLQAENVFVKAPRDLDIVDVFQDESEFRFAAHAGLLSKGLL